MEISIKIRDENKDDILAGAMEAISRASCGETQWELDSRCGYHKAECAVSVDKILPVFRALIEKYPKLDIFAMDCEDIREDDRSAQWWRSTTVRTVLRPDGTAELVRDSSTYWA